MKGQAAEELMAFGPNRQSYSRPTLARCLRRSPRPSLPLAPANIVAERHHQGSFRSLTRYKLVRTSADPQPFYLNRGPSGRQNYRSPRPTLSIAPTWLKSRESSDEAKEKSTQVWVVEIKV